MGSNHGRIPQTQSLIEALPLRDRLSANHRKPSESLCRETPKASQIVRISTKLKSHLHQASKKP
ncbi:MAG: hypothetical protein CMO80_10710 [Verrucomicrobiales bacterium]|nr:hypothetical protein [Verrucomicrobiales bacterium]